LYQYKSLLSTFQIGNKRSLGGTSNGALKMKSKKGLLCTCSGHQLSCIVCSKPLSFSFFSLTLSFFHTLFFQPKERGYNLPTLIYTGNKCKQNARTCVRTQTHTHTLERHTLTHRHVHRPWTNSFSVFCIQCRQ